MTREQIEAMTDKEINAYIAEKVMGWPKDGKWVMELDGKSAYHFHPHDMFFPAKSLDHAIEAAEKVGLSIPDPDDQVAFRFSMWWSVGRWLAGWYNPDRATDQWHLVGSAPSLALAVCRAVIARKSMGS